MINSIEVFSSANAVNIGEHPASALFDIEIAFPKMESFRWSVHYG